MAPPIEKSDNSLAGCLFLVVLVVLGLAASKCSSNNSDAPKLAAAEFSNATASAISAQDPKPVEPLNPASVRRGVADLRLVVAAEGVSGAMIYSQNCYEGLTHTFSWKRLDVCGAADVLAARSFSGSEIADSVTEAAYFESETVAGRYLAAAVGAGEEASEADVRLEKLQTRIGRAPSVGNAAPMDDDIEMDSMANAVSENSDGEFDETGRRSI